MPARILVVDNYDSFVYNLVQYLGELGAEPVVFRNDQIDVDGAARLDPAGVLISPGPGEPTDAGVSNELIEYFAGRRPVLGVCLGHQCIGQVYGASIGRAPVLMHGKTSLIDHDGVGVFAGLPSPLEATRYHSLVIEPDTFPAVLEVTARSAETARSWAYVTATSMSKACSSTPSRSSRSPVTICSTTSCARARLSRPTPAYSSGGTGVGGIGVGGGTGVGVGGGSTPMKMVTVSPASSSVNGGGS